VPSASVSPYPLSKYRFDDRELVSIVEAARLLGIGRSKTYEFDHGGSA
jgi:hypothetical protein